MDDANSQPKETRVFCNHCGTITRHFLKFTYEATYVVPDFSDEDVSWYESSFNLWACAGCDTPSLQYITSDEFMTVEQTDNPRSTFYPKRRHNEHKRKWFVKLPPKLQEIYSQSVEAFNNDLFILAAGGLRALIEGICVDKGISGRNLETKINNMSSLLPQNIVDNIHSFRFIGNEAMHELSPPYLWDLKKALEVSEDLLNYLYDLDYKTSQLPKR